MKSLTLIITTCRIQPHYDWILDSLLKQNDPPEDVKVIAVDFHAATRKGLPSWVKVVEPKPTVWQGKHRVTRDHWWAKSNALNTALCLADSEWIACVDDCCVLVPTWLTAVKDAMRDNYVVCGTYEKRFNMVVEDGYIVDDGLLDSYDHRWEKDTIKDIGGHWFFGCSNAMPLAWALEANGYDESCDGLRYEDVVFGGMVQRNGHPIKWDSRMKVVQSRNCNPNDVAIRGWDKGKSPNDKSHALLKRVAGATRATHVWNIPQIRDSVLKGGAFPSEPWPTSDWYDQMPIKDFDKI
jgi:hypothetical protein